MAFYERLDTLMKSQGITNARLAMALSVDTSLISRWRKGTRTPGRGSSYVTEIAEYFFANARKDSQKAALYEVMGAAAGTKSNRPADLCDKLKAWLNEKDEADALTVGGFLSGISHANAGFKGLILPENTAAGALGTPVTVQTFYGIKGKQSAAEQFLKAIIAQGKPCTLLLYSDENADWIFEDRSFRQQWSVFMQQAIAFGCNFKIIHTINRDITEMLAAIKGWLPLYLTGVIEPYYYPKYYKSIFRKTLFIAAPLAAITSDGIGEDIENTVTFVHYDKRMLAGLENRFYTYLDLCRPLMQIFTTRNYGSVIDVLTELASQEGNVLFQSIGLTALTIPNETFQRILTRLTEDEGVKLRLLHLQKSRKEGFSRIIGRYQYTEYLSLPKMEDILEGRAGVPFINLFAQAEVYYTPQEFTEHLRQVVAMLKQYPNYQVYLYENLNPDISIHVKEDVGAVIIKHNRPTAVFAVNQPGMTEAFYSYLENEQAKIPQHMQNKAYSIQVLEELIAQLNC